MVLNDDLGPTIPQDPIARFEDFLRMFEYPAGNFVYLTKIKAMIAEDSISLLVDFEHLIKFDIQLARDLHENPDEYLEKANQALVNLLHEQSGGAISLKGNYFLRFSNLSKHYKVKLRKIRSRHMERLLSISGSLIRTTNVEPQITIATFECKLCGARHSIAQMDTELTYPAVCNVGGCKASKNSDFRLLGKHSDFRDWQQIRVQEKPDELTSGNVPRFLDCLLLDDLVDTCRPGDRVTLIGVIKIVPVSRNRKALRVFHKIMHVNNIYSEDEDNESMEITQEDEKEFYKVAADPKIHDNIVQSIAPDIYGHDEIKLAAALVLFGGVHKTKSTGHNIRGDIHVLVMGDPGTGKSQIIKSVSKLAPRAVYTSGQGSTAAGLTAAVLRDESTGGMVLEAGALVLADGGLAAIDEFDKMKHADRVAIHEAMEQQSYHPSTEILFADGNRVMIGDFVDSLMQDNENQIIQGINCEILRHAGSSVYTTDFKEITKIHTDRVSRHKAPDHFYEISFSNGRRVTVTPEHPVYVHGKEEIITREAREIKTGDYVPVPRYLPNSAVSVELIQHPSSVNSQPSKISTPESLTPPLARILGSFTMYGRVHQGSKIDICIPRKDDGMLNDIASLVEETFQFVPYTKIREEDLVKLQFSSAELVGWLKLNFPRMMEKAPYRRIPTKVMGASSLVAREFLIGAFLHDGIVGTAGVYYKIATDQLGNDYQDLLLKLGIQSHIIRDSHNGSCNLYINGESLELFFKDNFMGDSPVNDKIENGVNIGHGPITPQMWMSEKNHGDILWNQVIGVKRIENIGDYYTPWVYDITIEPTHSFISSAAVLHNTVSIAKAGIVATLNARTSIIAAANPKLGRYDDSLPASENINLQPSILSRFDLLFIVIDVPHKDSDSKVAEHILKLHMPEEKLNEEESESILPALNLQFLKKYIAYARAECEPVLTPEAAAKIKEFYLRMRKSAQDDDEAPIPIVARTLEGMIRLSEAHAKMALRKEILVEDVQSIIGLQEYSMKQVGWDEDRQTFDVDSIQLGRPRSKTQKMKQILTIIKNIQEENDNKPVSMDSLLERAAFEDFGDEEVKELVQRLNQEGLVIKNKKGHLMRVSD